MIYQFFKSLALLLTLIAFSSNVIAQDSLSNLEQSELDALEKGEKLNRDQEVTDDEESQNQSYFEELKDSDQDILIRQVDREQGIYLQDYTTNNDSHRLGINYHFNTDLMSPFEVTTLEGNYAYRLGVAWLELSIAYTTGKYRELTLLNTTIGTESTDQQEQNATNLSLGTGIGYRTRYIRNLINSKNIFESVAGYLTYNSFNDNFRAETYTGYGIKADFGVHKRVSTSGQWGFKLSYHLATVRKAAETDQQASAARSLTITWLTFGLDYSIYF